MPDYVIESYYIGTMPELDPIDGPGGAENNSILLGASFGSVTDPFYSGLVNVTLHDDYEDPAFPGQPLIASNDAKATPEEISLDGIRSVLDTVFYVDVEVTYSSGTTVTETPAGSPLRMLVVQDELGRAFLMPRVHGRTETLLGAEPIQNITVTAVYGSEGELTSLYADLPADAFVCFVAGTQIRTPNGNKPIEYLQAGDMVDTFDNGPQPVIWIGSQRIQTSAKSVPVRISAGTLGPKGGARDLFVSQQHRVLLQSNRLKKFVNGTEAFTAAKHIIKFPGVYLENEVRAATYYHLLLNRHEIVFAENVLCESFYLGSEGRKLLTDLQISQLEKLGIMSGGVPVHPTKLARPCLRKRDVNRLLREQPDAPLARLSPPRRALFPPANHALSSLSRVA